MEADFWNENAGENALAQLISFQKSEQNLIVYITI